uniref:EGF-like domain-containing protein n=1 Tax=Cyprinus carpio carpio TaxID=630221 RepID=A0A9J8BE99_CYPCA
CVNHPSTVTFQFIKLHFISDIHECLDSESVCGPNSHCYNYNGSFSCFCWGGYNVSDGNKAISKGNPCTDIDECLLSPSVCGPNANCTNEMGSYNCSCLDGFTATNSSLSISINNTCRGTFCFQICVCSVFLSWVVLVLTSYWSVQCSVMLKSTI